MTNNTALRLIEHAREKAGLPSEEQLTREIQMMVDRTHRRRQVYRVRCAVYQMLACALMSAAFLALVWVFHHAGKHAQL